MFMSRPRTASPTPRLPAPARRWLLLLLAPFLLACEETGPDTGNEPAIDPAAEALTGGDVREWVITGLRIDTLTFSPQDTNCFSDNNYRFELATQDYLEDNGALKCEPDEADQITGRWELSNDASELTVLDPNGGPQEFFTIRQLDSTQAEVSYFASNGQEVIETWSAVN